MRKVSLPNTNNTSPVKVIPTTLHAVCVQGLVYLTLLLNSYAVGAAPIPDYTLESGQWHQLVIPGNSTGQSVQSIFADDLPESQYNLTWAIYRWDVATGQYVNPGLSGSIPIGIGFWIIQLTGSPVILDVPGIAGAPLNTSATCSSIYGCSEIPIVSNSSGHLFNMIGSALPEAHVIDNLRLVTEANGGDCSSGCNHNLAADLNFVERSIWHYDPASGTYLDLAVSGSLKPWESAWINALPAMAGATANYLFPATSGPSSDSECQPAPALPPLTVSDPGKTIVRVSTESELQNAIGNLSANTVVLIAPGTYQLSSTLWVRDNNVTIRGDSDRCDAVRLVGEGMENPAGLDSVPHGIWTDADNIKIHNLAIESVYYHPIAIDALAQAPHIYNVLMLDAGEQFVKVSSGTEDGSNNGRVEYSVMKYTDAPPTTDHGGGTGYTQGVDVHRGDNWVVSNNRFENFHTPDTADHLFNPVVLFWNLAQDSLVENNIFIDVDRAIGFGLAERANDHSGGIIRNNMIVLRENLFSESRRSSADGLIIVWNSPNSQVLHNTVLSNGNTPNSIQLRFDSNGAIIRNNLIDAPIGDRSNNQYIDADNILFSDASIFKDTLKGDLHLTSEVPGISNAVPTLNAAPKDIDGQNRTASQADAGADEFSP